jgi:phosphate transport system substrate-binding protein
MHWLRSVVLCSSAVVILQSCNNAAPKHTDTPVSGTLAVSADETYQPIMDEQLKVFDSGKPEAHITINYKPETECFKDFLDGKTRFILVSRDLTKSEKDLLQQKQVWSTTVKLARDGVAVILNNAATDTLLDLDALRGILTNVYNKKYNAVFDNEASGTVRFIKDSILKGGALGSNVFAMKDNKAVVDYVAKNPNAIGFVGLDFVNDDNDTDNIGAFIKTVHVAAIKNDSTGEFLKPYQAYIALKTYPLTRTLYYITSESYRGLANGFGNFLTDQRGQLIFFHAHFFPVVSEMVIRDASINTDK